MKTTYHNKKIWLTDAGEDIIGVGLGADFTAEHEWGIRPIQELLKIDYSKIGANKRTVKAKEKDIRENILLHTAKKLSFFAVHAEKYWIQSFQRKVADLSYSMRSIKEDGFYAEWSSKGFLVVMEESNYNFIADLHLALLNNNLMVYIGASMPAFDNGGLVLAIKDRVPKEYLDEMKKADQTVKKLKDDAEKTGIEKILEKAGKNYYCLSPSRPFIDNKDGTYTTFKDKPQQITKHNIMFFLNPYEQHKYCHGWYTVEDLNDWANDRGRVIKI